MGFWTPGLISGLYMIISDPQFMLQTFELNYGVAPCPGPGDVTGGLKMAGIHTILWSLAEWALHWNHKSQNPG